MMRESQKFYPHAMMSDQKKTKNELKHYTEFLNVKALSSMHPEIKKLKTNNWLRIKLVEGKNREIRKIFESLGFVVNRIIRTHYGSYSLNKMKTGEFKKMIIKKI